MKIGIITIQKCDNFGADLQAYALGAKLRSLGYDAENIDYLFYKHPRHLKRDRVAEGKLEVEKWRGSEKPILPISLVNRLKEFLFPIITGFKNLKRRKVIRERHAKFAAWTDKHLKCGSEYRSVASLYANPPRYDVYMVGSDQVWNPRMNSNILPYFLDFVPAGAKCISYAASFGVSNLPAVAFYRFKQLLGRFSAISMREKAAADIVRSMALGVEVKHVVDPTLLLTAGEWETVSNKVEGLETDVAGAVSSLYLLLYDLIESPETVALAKRVAETRGLEIVRIGDGAYGPGEFVWLFAHAECVVTNSFHGTAFSLLHGKDFVSVVPRGMANASRIESVLKSVGTLSQLVRAEDAATVEDLPRVNWERTFARLAELREDAISFLRRAIDEPAQKIGHRLPIGCYAVWNSNDSVRAASTSGGLFRVLAERTIRNGGVVYGAAFSKDFHKVSHQGAETVEALDPLMKSKYVWSDPTVAYKQAVLQLKAGREVLFTGTPCQIAAIKALAKDVDEKLITMDIICHGTPRPEIFEAYVVELEQRYGGKLTRYEFRNKDSGWNFPHVVAEFSNRGGGYDMILRNDPYYLGFGLNVTLRPGCFQCPFANLERVADFTIGDCWRIAASHSEWDDGQGTSLMLVNTPKAVAIWKDILASGTVKGGAYDLDLAQMRNMPLMQRPHKPECYRRFQQVFVQGRSFKEAAKVYMSRRLTAKASVTYWVKKLGWFYFRHRQ